jgi:hypothetical protein
MTKDAVLPSGDDLAMLAAQLTKLVAATDAIQERQVSNEELQLELVKFLSTTAQRHQEQIDALTQMVQTRSDGLRALGFNIGEAQKSQYDALQKQLTNSSAEVKANTDARIRSVYSLTATSMRKSAPLGGRIRCIFLIHAIETWDALADLHQAMLQDERFTPIVATINRRYPGQDGFGNEDKTSAYLSELGVKHLRFGMQDAYQALEILKTMAPDIIFRQSQWDNDIPRAFSAVELQFAKLCFIPYASTIIDRYGVNEKVQDSSSIFAYNQPYHQLAWRIYSETRFSAENYRRFHGADPSKVVLSGFPKNERIMRARGSDDWPISNDAGRRYRVVWAPHHSLGPGWLAFGVFHLIFDQMLAWAMQRPDIDFVLKPHPALFSTAVKEAHVSQARIDQFETIWHNLPNCDICTGQYADLFGSSDLLITDGVSFLTEFQLFDKPLVFFDSRRHVPFNELGELAEAAAEVVTSFDELQAVVLGYMGGKPWERGEQRARLRDAMVPHDRPAVDMIMDDIADGLGVDGGARNPELARA